MSRKILLQISILSLTIFSCKLLKHKDNNIVKDFDGNVYHTVKIGTQTWLVENLISTHYNNGEPIENVADSIKWIQLKTGAYCNFKNTESYSLIHGRLYNGYTVNDKRNICPKGWHIPSDKEWTILTDFLGGEKIAGGKLKESGTAHWTAPNKGANNESGFTAIPGGCRITGMFYIWEERYDGNYARYWSSTVVDVGVGLEVVLVRFLNFYDTEVFRSSQSKEAGYFVRCIKD